MGYTYSTIINVFDHSMKNLLIVLAVVILGAGGWYLYSNNMTATPAPEQKMAETYSEAGQVT